VPRTLRPLGDLSFALCVSPYRSRADGSLNGCVSQDEEGVFNEVPADGAPLSLSLSGVSSSRSRRDLLMPTYEFRISRLFSSIPPTKRVECINSIGWSIYLMRMQNSHPGPPCSVKSSAGSPIRFRTPLVSWLSAGSILFVLSALLVLARRQDRLRRFRSV